MSGSRLLSDAGVQDTIGLGKLVARFRGTSEFIEQCLSSFAGFVKGNNLIFFAGNESPEKIALSFNHDGLESKWEIQQGMEIIIQKSEQEIVNCIDKLKNGNNEFKGLMTSIPFTRIKGGSFESSLQTAVLQLRDLHHGILDFMHHNGILKLEEEQQRNQEVAAKSPTDLVNGILKKLGYVANELKFMADKLSSQEKVQEDEAIYSR